MAVRWNVVPLRFRAAVAAREIQRIFIAELADYAWKLKTICRACVYWKRKPEASVTREFSGAEALDVGAARTINVGN